MKKLIFIFLLVYGWYAKVAASNSTDSNQISFQSSLPQYEETCNAGPFQAGDSIGECEPESGGGVHIANGFDQAYKCALDHAVAKCKIAGNSNCKFLTYINKGFQVSPTDQPGYGSCVVQVYVTGDNGGTSPGTPVDDLEPLQNLKSLKLKVKQKFIYDGNLGAAFFQNNKQVFKQLLPGPAIVPFCAFSPKLPSPSGQLTINVGDTFEVFHGEDLESQKTVTFRGQHLGALLECTSGWGMPSFLNLKGALGDFFDVGI